MKLKKKYQFQNRTQKNKSQPTLKFYISDSCYEPETNFKDRKS
jgi:hypothetical protein